MKPASLVNMSQIERMIDLIQDIVWIRFDEILTLENDKMILVKARVVSLS
jgi:hypothetical protein